MKLKILFSRYIIVLLLLAIVMPFPAVEAAADLPKQATDEFTPATTLADGMEIFALEINSPPEPPVEFEEERAASVVSSLDRATTLPNFPSYDWVFGCSAVSAAMIAAYFDNNGYPNMYTGSHNGGVMPISDMFAPYTGTYIWGTWLDSDSDQYQNNPLVASHDGVDGRSGYGSIDDYWLRENGIIVETDPYITAGRPQHSWGTAVGDYMKTSQSAYNNADGSTRFWNYTNGSPLPCNSMPDDDGTLGRKQFYEAVGYTVTECYNQNTTNNDGDFSLTDFQTEIDNGNPVLLNLDGHSIVGFGYSGSTIYIRDTWDSNPGNVYSMTWGGFYAGRELLSVSIVHLEDTPTEPGAFGKSSPSNGATNQWTSLTLSWGSSSGATGYEYCYWESGGICTSWTPAGTSTSVELSGLSGNTTYEWQVRANNSQGTTYANGSEAAEWSFTTIDLSSLTETMFLPLMVRD